MPGTRKLGRKTDHRRAMLRGQVTLLLKNGSIKTTVTRAKEIAPLAEKMITLGKKNTLAARRAAMAFITEEDVVSKVFGEIAAKYANRNGGYTQLYRLGARRGDAAEMALLKLFEEPVKEEKKAPAKKKSAPRKKAAPKAEEAKEEVKEEAKAEEPKAEEPKTEAPAEEKAE